MKNDYSEKNILKIKKHLKDFLTSARFKHSIGVSKVAVMLAEHYGISKEKALLAALLHDAGKGFSKKGMANYIKRNKIKVSCRNDVLKHGISLCHGNISAHIAKTKFGISDPEILNSIRSHTLGGTNMSTLAKIIYLSDACSPDRRHPYVKSLRNKIKRDIDSALLFSMKNKLSYIIKKNKWIHPDAVKAWNNLIKKRPFLEK